MSEAHAIATYSNCIPILYPTPKIWSSTPIYIYYLKVSCATSPTYTINMLSQSPEEMILGLLQVCGLPPRKIARDG